MPEVRYYLTRTLCSTPRYIRLDYSVPEHYVPVALRDNATSYASSELAQLTVEFLGGPEAGFAYRPEREDENHRERVGSYRSPARP